VITDAYEAPEPGTVDGVGPVVEVSLAAEVAAEADAVVVAAVVAVALVVVVVRAGAARSPPHDVARTRRPARLTVPMCFTCGIVRTS
jgi:hypothetical protein